MTGVIYSVNDISGIPILYVNSDDVVFIDGTLKINSVSVSGLTSTTTLTSILKTFCSGAFFDYYVQNGSNMRIGTVMTVWDGTNITYTDYSTTDIGDTSPVSMSTAIVSTNVNFVATITSGTWVIKLAIRLI